LFTTVFSFVSVFGSKIVFIPAHIQSIFFEPYCMVDKHIGVNIMFYLFNSTFATALPFVRRCNNAALF